MAMTLSKFRYAHNLWITHIPVSFGVSSFADPLGVEHTLTEMVMVPFLVWQQGAWSLTCSGVSQLGPLLVAALANTAVPKQPLSVNIIDPIFLCGLPVDQRMRPKGHHVASSPKLTRLVISTIKITTTALFQVIYAVFGILCLVVLILFVVLFYCSSCLKCASCLTFCYHSRHSCFFIICRSHLLTCFFVHDLQHQINEYWNERTMYFSCK